MTETKPYYVQSSKFSYHIDSSSKSNTKRQHTY